MLTQSDSGTTRCCKCECHRYREPRWACSLCGRGFTRKFNVLRHLDTKHEGRGAPIPYDEYRIGKSYGETVDVVTRFAQPKSTLGVSPKTRQMLALIDKHAKGQIAPVLAARVKNPDKNIIISSKICKSCLGVELDGYLYTYGANEIALPRHSCSCEWLFDYPSIDKKRELVETYLNEKIGTWLSEVLSSFESNSDQIIIRFKKLTDLELARLGYFISSVRSRREANDANRLIYNLISDELKNIELEIVDDIARNYISLDIRQFRWLSHLNENEGEIVVSRQEGLQFLQFFKTNHGKIVLRVSRNISYYQLLIH